MKILTVSILILTMSSSCTYEVSEMGNQDRVKGILGVRNQSQVGKSFVIAPNLITGVQIGANAVFQDFQTAAKPSAEDKEQQNAEDISIAITSTPISGGLPLDGTVDWLQAKLRWGTGQAFIGEDEDPIVVTVGGSSVEISPLVLIDINYGTVISIPGATYLDVQLRLNGVDQGGYVANDEWAPSYRVNVAVSYGGLSAFSEGAAMTMTQYAPTVLAQHDEILFARPQFASAFRLVWNDSPPVPAGLTVQYFGTSGLLQAFDYISPNSNPSPLMPWIPGAIAINVVNNAGAGDTFAPLACISYLTL